MRIFDATMSTLERSLDVRLARQTVLAGNLANANTPGYAPRDLDFAAAMAAAASSETGGEAAHRSGAPAAPEQAAADRPGDLPISSLRSAQGDRLEAFVGEVPGAAPGLDGNAVDLDTASASLAENSLQYGAADKAVAKKLAILRYAATDGQGG
jgi:flagellar basal-body rod protein FlgB